MIGNQAEDAHETYFFKALSSVNKSLFSDDEIKTINNISTKFKGKSSKNLSEWSHKFIGWQKTNDSKIISYDYSKYLDL
jgi:hypothetical protein